MQTNTCAYRNHFGQQWCIKSEALARRHDLSPNGVRHSDVVGSRLRMTVRSVIDRITNNGRLAT